MFAGLSLRQLASRLMFQVASIHFEVCLSLRKTPQIVYRTVLGLVLTVFVRAFVGEISIVHLSLIYARALTIQPVSCDRFL